MPTTAFRENLPADPCNLTGGKYFLENSKRAVIPFVISNGHNHRLVCQVKIDLPYLAAPVSFKRWLGGAGYGFGASNVPPSCRQNVAIS